MVKSKVNLFKGSILILFLLLVPTSLLIAATSTTASSLPAPVISAISPDTLPATSYDFNEPDFTATNVTVSGTGFVDGSMVQFYNSKGSWVRTGGMISQASTRLVVIVNFGGLLADTYTVVVKNPDGQVSAGRILKTIDYPAPMIFSTTPNTSGQELVTLTINGSGFLPGARVELWYMAEDSVWRAVTGTIQSQTATKLVTSVDMRGQLVGDYLVTVRNPDNKGDNNHGRLHVSAPVTGVVNVVSDWVGDRTVGERRSVNWSWASSLDVSQWRVGFYKNGAWGPSEYFSSSLSTDDYSNMSKTFPSVGTAGSYPATGNDYRILVRAYDENRAEIRFNGKRVEGFSSLFNLKSNVPKVDGGWSNWGTCSGGTQTRTCTNPTPSGGGATCAGSSTQSCSTAVPSPSVSVNVSNYPGSQTILSGNQIIGNASFYVSWTAQNSSGCGGVAYVLSGSGTAASVSGFPLSSMGTSGKITVRLQKAGSYRLSVSCFGTDLRNPQIAESSVTMTSIIDPNSPLVSGAQVAGLSGKDKDHWTVKTSKALSWSGKNLSRVGLFLCHPSGVVAVCPTLVAGNSSCGGCISMTDTRGQLLTNIPSGRTSGVSIARIGDLINNSIAQRYLSTETDGLRGTRIGICPTNSSGGVSSADACSYSPKFKLIPAGYGLAKLGAKGHGCVKGTRVFVDGVSKICS